MKWKSDSIQQFIRYKIQHPQQIFMLFKNYQAQKRHNEQIDQLYKQLNKCRSQLNHFKTELFKLNQVAGQQLQANRQQIDRIDDMVALVGNKIIKAKALMGVTAKDRKNIMIQEYQEEIKRLERQKQNDEKIAGRQIQQIRNKIDNQMANQKREGVKAKIQSIKNLIQTKINEKLIKEQKLLKVNELTQKQTRLKDNVSITKSLLTQIKLARQQSRKQERQAKHKKSIDTIKRLQKLKNQFLNILQEQTDSQPSAYLQQFLSFDTESIGGAFLQDRKWNQCKVQLSESVSTVRQYLRRAQYCMATSLGADREEGRQAQVNSDVMKESRRYLGEFGLENDVAGLEQLGVYEKHLKTIADKVQKIRTKSHEYFEIEDKQLKNQQLEHDAKEKQLDKEIVQLQAKIHKTDIQISKFLKNKQ